MSEGIVIALVNQAPWPMRAMLIRTVNAVMPDEVAAGMELIISSEETIMTASLDAAPTNRAA